MPSSISSAINIIKNLSEYNIFGSVCGVKGLLIEAKGITSFASLGSICNIQTRINTHIKAEVIGFREDITLLMPYSDLSNIGAGCIVELQNVEQNVYPSESWRGRVLNCFAEAIDGKGELSYGDQAYAIKAVPPLASVRSRIKQKLDTGIRSLNAFITCCKGQRLGIFSGSGVGKSILLSMLTKYSNADIKVIGLIGERGREVQEFIEDNLGEEGLKNAVLVVATSDESALSRRRAAYLTLAISEYFRDQGKDVLTMMDSVTRFAMAQREIGLAAGEPPTAKGYTPSVFSEMPKLLERAGTAESNKGTITAFFSVLVEGDDHNEPIADTARGILDGHIYLDRKIANRGRFPAVNILTSVSRMLPKCNNDYENRLINKAREYLALYSENEDLIKIGAYKFGTNEEIDTAIKYYPKIEAFLSQAHNQHDDLQSSYVKLAQAIDFIES